MATVMRAQVYEGDVLILDSDENEREKEDNSYMGQGKICSELTDYYLSLNVIRVINNSLYLYDKNLGCLKKLREGREAVELIKLVQSKIRRNRISSKTIEEVIKRLKNIPEINLEYEDLNNNLNLINCKNGVLDIKTGELLIHDINYSFTYCVKANYKMNNALSNYCETINFLKSSLENNKDKINLLFEIIGYLLSDFSNAKKAFVFIGKPHSGKSLLTKMITNIIGRENVSSIPLHKLGERFSNSELSTHKLNINAELDASPLTKIGNFKAIVGNDFISAEFKGKDLFSFQCKTKLLFAGNYMPEVKDVETTQAFVDRLVFLIFNKSTPKEEIDYDLEEKLMKEIDYIFSLSMDRLRDLLNNNFQFTIPEDSQKFLNEYSNRQNHISEFIEEMCILNEEAKIHVKNLYNTYSKFCEENCVTAYNPTKFNEYIANIDDIRRTRFRANGKNLRGFEGITIKKSIPLERNAD